MTEATGLIFELDTFAVHDGPGIRLAVYLKGCPLSCAWCHSPESQRLEPELLFLGDRCQGCGACAAACSQGVHAVGEGAHTLERSRCQACGRCVEACGYEALKLAGTAVTAEEIVARAVRMKPFFQHSGGGITLTGGEVTGQPEFAAAVLRGCREHGVHTAIETAGACAWETLSDLLAYTDLVLYDLKLIDAEAHRRWAGAPNRQILKNAARLATAAAEVQVRIALIPGITDTEANLRAVFGFMREVGLRKASLLPYNESTAAKYEWLGRDCEVRGEALSPQEVEMRARLAGEYGVAVSR